jgi:hypothetical protein
MTWHSGHIPVSPRASSVSLAASSARPVPWPEALQQLEASNGSLSSSKKSQPAMSSS